MLDKGYFRGGRGRCWGLREAYVWFVLGRVKSECEWKRVSKGRWAGGV